MFRKCLLTLSAVVALLTTSSVALAGPLFEPYGTYQVGGKIKAGTEDFTFNSGAYGGRIGLQLLYILFGAEYLASKHSVEREVNNSQDYEFSSNAYGPFVGVQLPLTGIRFMGTYFLSDRASLSSVDANGVEKSNFSYKGNGYKLGVWFRLIPFVHMGFEYLNISYGKARDNRATQPVFESKGYDRRAAMISLSLPLGW